MQQPFRQVFDRLPSFEISPQLYIYSALTFHASNQIKSYHYQEFRRQFVDEFATCLTIGAIFMHAYQVVSHYDVVTSIYFDRWFIRHV